MIICQYNFLITASNIYKNCKTAQFFDRFFTLDIIYLAHFVVAFAQFAFLGKPYVGISKTIGVVVSRKSITFAPLK